MNGKRARAIKRTYGVTHVHEVPVGWPIGVKLIPRWLGGWLPTVYDRVTSG